MKQIQFRMAAMTDMGMERTNNEDNFQASSNLSIEPMRWVNNELCDLSGKGALLVVADGMGGMNAGEVASDIAIETIKDAFRPDNITYKVVKNSSTIEKFMNNAILAADENIKREGQGNTNAKGMGTTIVIGWLLDGKLYVSWCGDSRAYVYNPHTGLRQITKDHSYVQSLIDKGSITREEAFDFPESNIITRSLSDSAPKAIPESLAQPYEVHDEDVIMFCTDGLSGLVRDSEIEAVIQANTGDMGILANSLIKAACDAGGTDNITVCLCKIETGGRTDFAEEERKQQHGEDSYSKLYQTKQIGNGKSQKSLLAGIIIRICSFAALLVLAVCYYCSSKEDPTENDMTEQVMHAEENKDSIDNDVREDTQPDPVREKKPEKPKPAKKGGKDEPAPQPKQEEETPEQDAAAVPADVEGVEEPLTPIP